MFALSPLVIFHAFTTGTCSRWRSPRSLWSLARAGPVLAGVLIGLGTAAKLYPLLFFIPLLALCWRTGQLRAFWRAAAGAVVAWAVVDLPVALLWPNSWLQFLKLNRARPADFDSLWYGFNQVVGSGNPGAGSTARRPRSSCSRWPRSSCSP